MRKKILIVLEFDYTNLAMTAFIKLIFYIKMPNQIKILYFFIVILLWFMKE